MFTDLFSPPYCLVNRVLVPVLKGFTFAKLTCQRETSIRYSTPTRDMVHANDQSEPPSKRRGVNERERMSGRPGTDPNPSLYVPRVLN